MKPIIGIIWDPEVVTPAEYAELVAALGDLVRAEGGAGVELVESFTVSVKGGSMKEVPYYTTDDESQFCGHIWKQRRDRPSCEWGFAWEVIPPFSEESEACGWRSTQEAAESAMNAALERLSK